MKHIANIGSRAVECGRAEELARPALPAHIRERFTHVSAMPAHIRERFTHISVAPETVAMIRARQAS